MAAIIHRDRRTADLRLRQYFNSTRDQWVEIVIAAVGARAGCTPPDSPRSSPGYYAWAAATTRMRQMFRREGWEAESEFGLETIVNKELRKKVAIMNTDAGTANVDRGPMNRTIKGAACQTVVGLNQKEMFKPGEMGPVVERPSSLWYLCIFDDEKKVRAELSRPIEFAGGYIVDFSERIFILEDGEYEKVLLDRSTDSGAQDFDINVRRK